MPQQAFRAKMLPHSGTMIHGRKDVVVHTCSGLNGLRTERSVKSSADVEGKSVVRIERDA
jgi:hypothetical protein